MNDKKASSLKSKGSTKIGKIKIKTRITSIYSPTSLIKSSSSEKSSIIDSSISGSTSKSESVIKGSSCKGTKSISSTESNMHISSKLKDTN